MEFGTLSGKNSMVMSDRYFTSEGYSQEQIRIRTSPSIRIHIKDEISS